MLIVADLWCCSFEPTDFFLAMGDIILLITISELPINYD